MKNFRNDQEIIKAAMRLLGQRRSERKAQAVRENGRLGGSPRRFAACPSGKSHRWKKDGHCYYCNQKKTALQLT